VGRALSREADFTDRPKCDSWCPVHHSTGSGMLVRAIGTGDYVNVCPELTLRAVC